MIGSEGCRAGCMQVVGKMDTSVGTVEYCS